MSERNVSLNGVQETLLLPLWGRAFETRKERPLLIDKTAVKIVESLNYDFSEIKDKVNPLSRASWIARSIYFDREIKGFLEKYPEGSVINVGCGLDTTYDRVNNGRAIWYEIDFPEVIEIRKGYIEEEEKRKFLSCSVFDESWYDEIRNTEHVMMMLAGVIYYFEEMQVNGLFKKIAEEFERCDIIFDYSSPQGIQVANRKVIEDGGMDKSAYLKWGIRDLRDIEKWNDKIAIISDMKMFREHKRKLPWSKRIGMIISDSMSIMSLAHIRISA